MTVLLEEQQQLRGLIMGAGTQYQHLVDFNPHILSVRAGAGGARAWGHGTWAGAEWANERVVPMKFVVRGRFPNAASWLEAWLPFAAAFAPIGTGPELEFRWVRGGVEWMLRGRPRLVEPDQSFIHNGYCFVQCAIVATDPLLYSGEESQFGPLTAPTPVGGLTLPLTLPVSIPARSHGGDALISNTGTVATGLQLRLTGPLSNAFVQIESPDGVLHRFDLLFSLAATDTLHIDTASKSVLLNGTTTRRGDITGDLPLLQPGVSRVRFHADGAGTLSGTWRNAWW